MKRYVPACLISLAALLLGNVAMAHSPLAIATNPAAFLTGLLLGAVWLCYSMGIWRVRPKARNLVAFQAATVITALAIFGPLDEQAETSTAAHMVQHMLMMVVIAPLWVIARPLPQWHALAPGMAAAIFRPLIWCVRYPLLSAAIHGAFIWFWHLPRFYVLALENPWWHAIEHLCFIVSGGIFWWSVLRAQRHGAPRAILALLFTLMHTGFLGALLTFANRSLYGADRVLADQQLAGLLMWVIGGFPYLAAAAWIGWRWFSRVARRTEGVIPAKP